MKCNKKDFEYIKTLNKISANVWNYCVEIDKENGQKLTLSQLEFMTKNKFPLHAKGIHHIVFKYLNARKSMWEVIKKNKDNGNKITLPYRLKEYMPTGWDSQAIHPEYDNNKIRLTCILGRGQIVCKVKSIPNNIAEIELVYKDEYYLSIKYKEENDTNLIQSDNIASIDLGEIHAITSIDKFGNCVIVTNRKIRSLIRLKDKRQGELQSLRSKCVKGSKQSKKYTKAIYDIKYEFDNKILDALHKQTNLYVKWCRSHKISKVYYGDLDTTTRNSKGKKSQKINHKLSMWRFGILIKQLQYKLFQYGIVMEEISEAYTSQTCPNCGNRKKTGSRNYSCKCGYIQHRDIVGAINILNFNTDTDLKMYKNKVYLQI